MYSIIIITVLNIVIMNKYNEGLSITVTDHLYLATSRLIKPS